MGTVNCIIGQILVFEVMVYFNCFNGICELSSSDHCSDRFGALEEVFFDIIKKIYESENKIFMFFSYFSFINFYFSQNVFQL